jgi:hypothetical protein
MYAPTRPAKTITKGQNMTNTAAMDCLPLRAGKPKKR